MLNRFTAYVAANREKRAALRTYAAISRVSDHRQRDELFAASLR